MRVSKVSIMKKIYSSTTNHNLFACLLFVWFKEKPKGFCNLFDFINEVKISLFKP
jgi:hypothetical protein